MSVDCGEQHDQCYTAARHETVQYFQLRLEGAAMNLKLTGAFYKHIWRRARYHYRAKHEIAFMFPGDT